MNYLVEYELGSTGFEGAFTSDCIDDVKRYIAEIKNDFSSAISVFSRKHNDFIFWKNCLSLKAEIDLIFTNYHKDLRTKTGMELN